MSILPSGWTELKVFVGFIHNLNMEDCDGK